jgi:hypothetical protein
MFNAIWLNKENEVSLRSYDKKWTPAKNKVLIEVKYSSINLAYIKDGMAGFHECGLSPSLLIFHYCESKQWFNPFNFLRSSISLVLTT